MHTVLSISPLGHLNVSQSTDADIPHILDKSIIHAFSQHFSRFVNSGEYSEHQCMVICAALLARFFYKIFESIMPGAEYCTRQVLYDL